MSWLGAAPATRKNFEMMLKEDSVAVVIGGLAEMYMQVSCVSLAKSTVVSHCGSKVNTSLSGIICSFTGVIWDCTAITHRSQTVSASN